MPLYPTSSASTSWHDSLLSFSKPSRVQRPIDRQRTLPSPQSGRQVQGEPPIGASTLQGLFLASLVQLKLLSQGLIGTLTSDTAIPPSPSAPSFSAAQATSFRIPTTEIGRRFDRCFVASSPTQTLQTLLLRVPKSSRIASRLPTTPPWPRTRLPSRC